LDGESRRVASAKNPRRWASLLSYSAAYVAEPRPGEPLPPVAVRGPLAAAGTAGGADAEAEITLRSDDPALVERLSQRLGRPVALLDQPPEAASLDQCWPPVEGRAFQDVTNELVLPAAGADARFRRGALPPQPADRAHGLRRWLRGGNLERRHPGHR
jgi:hypothetical protein